MNQAEFLSGGNLTETPRLLYVGGHKYQSRNDMVYRTAIRPPEDIVTDLICLRRDGWLWLGKYFAWDGCSGPTWDDATNMRAGMGHDGLYALHRMGLLPMDWREYSDAFLRCQMIKDGAWRVRANYYEWAVNAFGEKCAAPSCARQVQTAP